MRLVVEYQRSDQVVCAGEPQAEALGLLAGGYVLTAPNFLLIECAGIVWKKVRRREMTRRDGDDALAVLRSGLLDLTPTAPTLDRAVAVAHEIGHPLYDCIYLAAAEAAGASVVTADRRLAAAVSATRLADRVTRIEDLP